MSSVIDKSDMSQEDLEKDFYRSDVPLGIIFWAPWCPWSTAAFPLYEEIASLYEGKIRFAMVNVAETPEIISKYGVDSTPTVKFFFFGRVVGEIIGYLPIEKVGQEIERILRQYKEVIKTSTPTSSTQLCPYCGETNNCDCCIGYGAATGG